MLKIIKIRYRKIFMILFCLIYIAFYPRPAELYRLILFADAEVLFYTNKLPDDLNGYTVINNGINYEIKTNIKYAGKLRNKIDVTYQTIIFKGDADYIKRYLSFKQAEKINISNGSLYSGYSHMIEGSTRGGINIQIFVKGNIIYIGSPVIFGSY